MNRIKISPLVTEQALANGPQTGQQSKDGRGRAGQGSSRVFECLEKLAFSANDSCWLFVPLHHERKHDYPLVVWLHGDGCTADQIQDVMPQIDLRNYIGVAPEAPTLDREKARRWMQDPQAIEQVQNSVINAIDHVASRFRVDMSRIYLAGSQAGGSMAFRIAFQNPHLFAGVISLHGPLPTDQVLLGDWSRCRNVPVLWAHCRDCEEFDQDLLCEQLKLLHIAGFSVTLRQYAGSARLSDGMLADTNRWMMESSNSVVRDDSAE